MSTGVYKKRMRANWNQGKYAKGDAEERAYSKTEIKQQLKEAEENYFTPHKKGKRTRNEKARLEYRIKWYEDMLKRYEGMNSSLGSWFRSDLAKTKAKYEKLLLEGK